MGTTEIITIIPKSLVKDLTEKKKIEEHNSLPQISKTILYWVKEFMEDNVGYSNLPMAGISGFHLDDSEDVLHVIPGKLDESIMLLLSVPDDMIISIPYSKLLDYSDKVVELEKGNSIALDILHDEFLEELEVGDVDANQEIVSFIPFLDYSRCTCYALLNENFQIENYTIDGLPQRPFKQITSFT